MQYKRPQFRDLLYPVDSPRLTPFRHLDPHAFAQEVIKEPIPAALVADWRKLYAEPHSCITCDGHKETGLYEIKNEGAPTAQLVDAARNMLNVLGADELDKVRYPIDAKEWRSWSNPEFLLNPNGVRLEDLAPVPRLAIMNLIKASLSAKGFEKARGCMKTNAFLGQLCQLENIMNEWSYNFLLFGEPSMDGPWGWNLYGHHLCLNVFVQGSQMVISPTFMGAEPNEIDDGPNKGLKLFDTEQDVGLALMRSLPEALRERATVFKQMKDPAMPEGRWNPGDERALGGAFQDNRIIPYEGISVKEFSSLQKRQLLEIVEAFVCYLPEGPLRAKMDHVESMLDRTWWSWIGGHGEDDPFYYRIQSPVVMTEFDHHAGIWLANDTPAKCHIHTVVRTPNGNDYGKDLLRLHYEQVHPGKNPGTA
ncbi:Protein of unknown function [Duganella sp. CF517]|uniref:DUF3500 domain-containing protein n=1 Tax=Duganella sp. CF517 TaxID=1881038 RepID=UPI0008BA29FB|nr:DUF3500 domain-containing protein [Duganella sp. CF517]SEO09520.1 Protein of unknown function [Duganella sp. CF517]